MPGFFRGHLFHQAPAWYQQRYYTPQMMQLFNQVQTYLKTPPKKRDADPKR